MAKLSDIGARGLVVHDGSTYSYVLEQDWRALPLPKPKAGSELPTLVSLHAAIAVLSEDPIAVFVDLDEIDFRNAPKRPVAGAVQKYKAAASKRRIVLHDANDFFEVPETAWTAIDEDSAGDARVLVKRGTVVAAIPQNTIPSGTWCVLVNLKSLARYREG